MWDLKQQDLTELEAATRTYFDKNNMEELIDSKLTMVTNIAYSYVLQCVQKSGLNYQIQIVSQPRRRRHDQSPSPSHTVVCSICSYVMYNYSPQFTADINSFQYVTCA